VLGPPPLWRSLTTEWCPLPRSLAWVWWLAISRAQWSQAVEWREAFLVFARRPGFTSAEMVAYFFTHHCAPHDLVTLLEALVQEQVLLARDGRRIEEVLLAQCDAEGQWNHQHHRKGARV
jgi:hypothetical protein